MDPIRRDDLYPQAVRVAQVGRVGARPVLRPRPGRAVVACRRRRGRRRARRRPPPCPTALQRDVAVAWAAGALRAVSQNSGSTCAVGDRVLGRVQAAGAEREEDGVVEARRERVRSRDLEADVVDHWRAPRRPRPCPRRRRPSARAATRTSPASSLALGGAGGRGHGDDLAADRVQLDEDALHLVAEAAAAAPACAAASVSWVVSASVSSALAGSSLTSARRRCDVDGRRVAQRVGERLGAARGVLHREHEAVDLAGISSPGRSALPSIAARMRASRSRAWRTSRAMPGRQRALVEPRPAAAATALRSPFSRSSTFLAASSSKYVRAAPAR